MDRKEFRMLPEELTALMEACKPVRYMVFGGIEPRSQQQNANDAWKALGDKYGFDHMTVQPNGSDNHCFTAVAK